MKKINELIGLWLILVTALALGSGVTNAQDVKVKPIQLTVHPFLQIKRDLPEIKIVPGESESDKREKVRLSELSAQSRSVISRDETRIAPTTENVDLGTLRALYQSVGGKYGIDWKLIEAVHQVETGKSGSTCKRNPSGATGPMQFLPSTFRHYSSGDICNLNDAVDAAGNLLAQSGANSGDITSALLSYNHSMSYVNLVKSVMNSI